MLDPNQQRSWRAFLVGTTLLMDRLDRDLREQHRMSLPEYEILVRLAEADGNRNADGDAGRLREPLPVAGHAHGHPDGGGRPGRSRRLPQRRARWRRCSPSTGARPSTTRAPTHVAGVRQFLVDLVDENDFTAVGRVFDAVADRLIEANPAMDIR